MGAAALIATGGGLFFLWPHMQGGTPAPVAIPANPPAQTQPVSPVASAPVSAEKTGEPLVAEASKLASLEGSLRMADALFMSPEKRSFARGDAAGTRGVATASAEQGAKKDGERKALRAETAVSEIERPHSGKAAAIEKTDAAGTAQQRAEGAYRKAITAVNQGRVAEAVEGLRGALLHDGGHVAARQLLLKLLLEARRGDDVMRTLQEGLQLLPTQAGWAMMLARMQVERADLSGAAQTLERSLPAGAVSADYQGFAGHVLYRLGQNQRAADHYLVATRLAPRDGRWWLGLGLAHDAEGQVNEAREALLRAKASGNLSAELLAVIDQKLR